MCYSCCIFHHHHQVLDFFLLLFSAFRFLLRFFAFIGIVFIALYILLVCRCVGIARRDPKKNKLNKWNQKKEQKKKIKVNKPKLQISNKVHYKLWRIYSQSFFSSISCYSIFMFFKRSTQKYAHNNMYFHT